MPTTMKCSLLQLTLYSAILCLIDSAADSQRIHDCDSGHPADVIFLLDASNSIWRPDFQRQIGFIKDISRMFLIGPNNTQVAVITYANYPQSQFLLKDYSTKTDILAAIDNVRQMGGYHTSTPDALRYMRERGFSADSGGRGANVTRVGIVISDGESDDPAKTRAEATRAKDAGIHLFAVGVGSKVGLKELELIASAPSSNYTFMVENYSGLENIKDLLAIKACSVTDPPTTPATTTSSSPATTTIQSIEENRQNSSQDESLAPMDPETETGEMGNNEGIVKRRRPTAEDQSSTEMPQIDFVTREIRENEEHNDDRSNETEKMNGNTVNGDSKNKNGSKSKNKSQPRRKLSVCRPKTPLDVVFVVDSKSGDRRSHRQMLESVRRVVEQVDMDNGQMRVQFVHSCSASDQRLRNRSPRAKSLPVDGPGDVTAPSQTYDLFERMTSKLTANGRPGRKRVGVYLTNGPSGDLEKTLMAVQAAKNVHGIEMFTVGLGKEVNPVELRAISSCDVAKHMFTLRNQSHHSRSKEMLKHLARSLCSVR